MTVRIDPDKKQNRYETAIRIIETGEIFNTRKDCAERLNVTRGMVTSCLTGYAKSCAGYHLELIDREWPDDLDPNEWKEHPRYRFIYSNNDGELVSYKRGKRHKLMPTLASNGYLITSIGSYGYKSIHKLVAETWINNPENKPIVHHKDDNKINNRVDNLEWVTHKENTEYARQSGLLGNKTNIPIRIIETGEEFDSIASCTKSINGSSGDIGQCLKGERTQHLGYHFEII